MKNNLGLGVMLGILGGNAESVAAFTGAIGKTIESVELRDNELRLKFTDGTGVKLSDGGQSCCENRYMQTDDNLAEFTGAKLLGGEIKDAPSVQDEYEEHDVQFLEIQTDRGVFTVANHNEHNGYYGGFLIRASVI